jgi:hypothetical protein
MTMAIQQARWRFVVAGKTIGQGLVWPRPIALSDGRQYILIVAGGNNLAAFCWSGPLAADAPAKLTFRHGIVVPPHAAAFDAYQ